MNTRNQSLFRSSLSLLIATGALALAGTLQAATEPQRIVITAPGGATEAAARDIVLGALASPAGFEMDNGRSLQLQSTGGALRMRYGTRGHVTLRANDQNQFVSRDGQLVLTVAVDAHGDASGVRLSMPATWQ